MLRIKESSEEEKLWRECIINKVLLKVKRSCYLAMIDIAKKWTGKRREWGQIHSQLEIFFADRLSQ